VKIGILPDVQAKPGLDFKHLAHVGHYFAEKQPDVIVCLGDFADMPSLSSYDKGKRKFEGRRYKKDIDATKRAMDTFMDQIAAAPGYKPRLVLTLGNHENRINRAVDDQSELEGLLSTNDLKYADYGWEVHPFLEVVTISGVAFSHYFTSGTMGRPITTSAALLSKRHMSAVAFHQQGLQMSTAVTADLRMITGIICGSCYTHNEDYLGPQGNKHFRGPLVLNDVRNGEFEPMPVTLKYLKDKRYA
jgi:hypothetical protein